jgi:hypothetical protein
VRDSDAGTAPPTSVLWTCVTEKQTSSPSWKIGFHTCMSGECVHTNPEYGSLVTAMSPSS